MHKYEQKVLVRFCMLIVSITNYPGFFPLFWQFFVAAKDNILQTLSEYYAKFQVIKHRFSNEAILLEILLNIPLRQNANILLNLFSAILSHTIFKFETENAFILVQKL